MSAYIRWLAPRLDEVRREHERLTIEIRRGLVDISGAHPRHPNSVAQLMAAYRLYLGFAVEVGAIDGVAAERYATTSREYLLELAKAKAEPQREAKVGRTFLRLIVSALASKQCHIVNAKTVTPKDFAGACGLSGLALWGQGRRASPGSADTVQQQADRLHRRRDGVSLPRSRHLGRCCGQAGRQPGHTAKLPFPRSRTAEREAMPVSYRQGWHDPGDLPPG